MPAVLRRGVMDELATAASAVAIATDAFAEKDSELGLTFTTCLDVEARKRLLKSASTWTRRMTSASQPNERSRQGIQRY